MSLESEREFFEILLKWIDENLDKDLSIDKVSERSGFSKRYLQNEFRKFTGINLGEYIRLRRLTAASLKLRLTNLTPLEIANMYQWESQQTFTRAFTKNFGVPPSAWRKSLFWDHAGMLAAFKKEETIKYLWSVEAVNIYFLPELCNEYEVKSIQFFDHNLHAEKRLEIIKSYLTRSDNDGNFLFKSNIEPLGRQKRDVMKFSVCTGRPETQGGRGNKIHINGCYLRVFFSSNIKGLEEVIHYSHQKILPLTKCKKKKGPILFHFELANVEKNSFAGSLLIPVRYG